MLISQSHNHSRKTEIDVYTMARLMKFMLRLDTHDFDNMLQLLVLRIFCVTVALNPKELLNACGFMTKRTEFIRIPPAHGLYASTILRLKNDKREAQRKMELSKDMGDWGSVNFIKNTIARIDEQITSYEKREKGVLGGLLSKRGDVYHFFTQNMSRYQVDFEVEDVNNVVHEISITEPTMYPGIMMQLISECYILDPRYCSNIKFEERWRKDKEKFQIAYKSLVNKRIKPKIVKTTGSDGVSYITAIAAGGRSRYGGNGLCAVEALSMYALFNDLENVDLSLMVNAATYADQLSVFRRYNVPVVFTEAGGITLTPNTILACKTTSHVCYIRYGCKEEWNGSFTQLYCKGHCSHSEHLAPGFNGKDKNTSVQNKRIAAQHNKQKKVFDDRSSKILARMDAFREKVAILKGEVIDNTGLYVKPCDFAGVLPIYVQPNSDYETIDLMLKDSESEIDKIIAHSQGLDYVEKRGFMFNIVAFTKYKSEHLAGFRLKSKKEDNNSNPEKPCNQPKVVNRVEPEIPQPPMFEENQPIASAQHAAQTPSQDKPAPKVPPSTRHLPDTRTVNPPIMQRFGYTNADGHYEMALGLANEDKVYVCHPGPFGDDPEREFTIFARELMPEGILLPYNFKKFFPRIKGIQILFSDVNKTPEEMEKVKRRYCELTSVNPAHYVEPDDIYDFAHVPRIQPLCASIIAATPAKVYSESHKDKVARLREAKLLKGGNEVSSRSDVLFNSSPPTPFVPYTIVFVKQGKYIVHDFTCISIDKETPEIKAGVMQVANPPDTLPDIYTIKISTSVKDNYHDVVIPDEVTVRLYNTVVFASRQISYKAALGVFTSMSLAMMSTQNNKLHPSDPTKACMLLMAGGVYQELPGDDFKLMDSIDTYVFNDKIRESIVHKWNMFKVNQLRMPVAFGDISDIGVLSFLPWLLRLGFSIKTGSLNPTNPLSLLSVIPIDSFLMTAGLPVSSTLFKLGLFTNPKSAPYAMVAPAIEYMVTRKFMPIGNAPSKLTLTEKLVSASLLQPPFLRFSSLSSGIVSPHSMSFGADALRMSSDPQFTDKEVIEGVPLKHVLQSNANTHFTVFGHSPITEEIYKMTHWLSPTLYAVWEHYTALLNGAPSDLQQRIVCHNLFAAPNHIAGFMGVTNVYVRMALLGLGMYAHSYWNYYATSFAISNGQLCLGAPVIDPNYPMGARHLQLQQHSLTVWGNRWAPCRCQTEPAGFCRRELSLWLWSARSK